MAQYSSWVHGVAAQQEADVKQNESVAASSILEFNSTEPTASNTGVLHFSKRFQGKSGGAQRFYFELLNPNIVLGPRAISFENSSCMISIQARRLSNYQCSTAQTHSLLP